MPPFAECPSLALGMLDDDVMLDEVEVAVMRSSDGRTWRAPREATSPRT